MKHFRIDIDGTIYKFSKKQFQELKRLVKKRDYFSTDVSYENNVKEYETIIKKYQLLPCEF